MTVRMEKFLAGFAWAIPLAFADAVGACQFSRGDTLYSRFTAYREWDDEFYRSAEGLVTVKVVSPEAKPASASPGLFENNWNAPAAVEMCIHGERNDANRISTTQGRIYTLLWRGGISVLDTSTPIPPMPRQASYLLRLNAGWSG